ncbi:MAG: hypothetical protein SFV21_06095 [Rhodospirillaceae bacterium]|nr:hypothetical protein [Rhodospirillaceae bacterium]
MFSYSVNVANDFDSSVSSYVSLIQATTQAALADWGRYLRGSGSIDVRVEITGELGSGALAAAGPTSVFNLWGGSNVYRAGTLHELLTGTDVNGSTEDIIIYVDGFTLQAGQFYFGSGTVPGSQYDALTVLRHEVGHGLGFIGALDTQALQSSGADRFTFDSNVSFGGGIPQYVGTQARAYQGGVIELNDRDVSHLASSMNDLMTPSLGTGVRKEVSVLDALMLADAGALIAPQSIAPRVTTFSASALTFDANMSVDVHRLFNYRDFDGDQPVMFELLDRTAGGGYWTVNGVQQATGTPFQMSVEQYNPGGYSVVHFQTGPRTRDEVSIRVSDGVNWSSWTSFFVTSNGNTPPVATASAQTYRRGAVVAGTSLFSSSDVDGDALSYTFRNATHNADAGYFLLDGQRYTVPGDITLTQAQLGRVSYQVGNSGSNELAVSVHDGMAMATTGLFTVTVGPNHDPTVTASNVTLARGSAVAASALFSFADNDGDALMFTVNNVTGDARAGFWMVDGERLMGEFVISQANLRRLSYQVGTTGSNMLSIRATDGMAWSSPVSFQVAAPANAAPTVSAANVTLARNQVVLPAALFSFADADGVSLMFTVSNVTADTRAGYWMVDGQQLMGQFVISQANLARLSYRVGTAGTNTLSIIATDGVATSAPASFQVSAPPNTTPTISAPNVTLSRNQAIAATSLFSFADADGDSLMFTVNNVTGNPAAGFWAVDGERLMGEFVISQANLRRLSYQVGSAGSNTLSVRATDGMAWSSLTSFQVSAPPNNAPTVSASDVTLARNQVVLPATLFAFADADGDSLMFTVNNVTGNPAAGFWAVDGERLMGQFVISQANLRRLSYQVGGAGSNTLSVQATDGMATSALTTFQVAAPPNNAPTVTAANFTLNPGTVVAASDLFAFADADGDALMFTVSNVTGDTNAGFWMVDGERLMGQFVIAQGNLRRLSYQAGAGGSNTLSVHANDGMAWSSFTSFTVAAQLVGAPIVTGSDQILTPDETAAASSLFSVADPEGDAIARFQFRDLSANVGSGFFLVNGVPKAPNTVLDIAAADLGTVTFQGGRTLDNLEIRARDINGNWGAWSRVVVNELAGSNSSNVTVTFDPPPTIDYSINHAPILRANTAGNQPRNQDRALTDLVDFWDVDSFSVGNQGPTLVGGVLISGAVQTLEFRDDTGVAGTGYFVLDGQQAGPNVSISAQDFAGGDLAFHVGGPSLDNLQVRASDGVEWSAWIDFSISSTNARPVVTQAGSWTGAAPGQAIAVAPLFTVADADGDAMTRYQFVDGTAGGGQFRVDGVGQAADQIIDVLASQLAGTVFQASGAAGGADAVFARAFDGVAWSAWKSWNIVATA